MNPKTNSKSQLKNIKHDHYKSYRKVDKEKTGKKRNSYTTLPLHRSHPPEISMQVIHTSNYQQKRKDKNRVRQQCRPLDLRNPKKRPSLNSSTNSTEIEIKTTRTNKNLLARTYEQESVEGKKKKSPATLLGSLVT